MFFLVYVSSATHLFTEQELVDLLEVSRVNNAKLDVTGMLLYKEGNFMQFLEGPKDKVCALYEKIRLDPRHRGVLLLLQQEHTEREFTEWAMGFKRLDSQTPMEVPGYSDFLELPLTSEQFLLHPSRTLRLLMNFKQAMR